MKKIFSLLLFAVFFGLVLLGGVFATGQETCSDGNGWTKIDSNDLSLYPVSGATQYCFKAGSDNSVGCTGGIFSSWPQPEGTCGLSHWSYFIPQTTPTPTLTPTPGEEQHYACVRNTCSLVDGAGDNTCNNDNDCEEEEATPTPTLTVTPTPTNTPSNPGGPGDGGSDGRSDGLSSCPECTKAPQGQVLGSSTGPTKAVLGLSTTSGDNNEALAIFQLFAAFILTATGFKFLKNNA